MNHTADPRLQLAPSGSRAGTWLFLLSFVLPLVLVATAIAVPLLRGKTLDLVAGNLPLTLVATLGGAVLLCGVLWWVLARFMRRQALLLSTDAIEVRSSFYRCRTPLAELKLGQARVVDLDEHTELKPTLKTNGFSIPGFHSGWFLLRNRRRTFVAIADGRRKLWLPGSGRYDLLLEPEDPAALLARLRELAAARGAG
jgi:hypothetical protein